MREEETQNVSITLRLHAHKLNLIATAFIVWYSIRVSHFHCVPLVVPDIGTVQTHDSDAIRLHRFEWACGSVWK